MLLKNIVVLLLPFFVCCYEQGNLFRNDYTYNKDINYWLKINLMPLSWHEARKKCEFEGAMLASPLNNKIVSALRCALEEKHLNQAYIGLHSTFSDSDWQSIDGIPVQDMKLRENIDFSGQNNHKCAVIQSKQITTVNCIEKYAFICYKDASEVPRFTVCGTTDAEYKLDSRTGSCYKFHGRGATWSRAFEVCAGEGGHLAIIDNATEAQVVTDLYAKNPGVKIKASNTDLAHIGIRDWEGNGVWYTVHGKALDYTEYAVWEDGEPKDSLKNEFCGTVLRNGRFSGVPCSYKLAFICEKHPKSLAPDNTKFVLRSTLPDNSAERIAL